jgi:hypothetical protein
LFLCALAIGYGGYRAVALSSAVVWTELVNVTVTDGVLQKTSGCDGCFDAGGVSEQQITSGDGYIEFTIGETHTLFVAGLSHGNSGTGYADVDFAFRFNGAGWADVLESGTYVGGDTTYAVGDVFRVAVVGGTIQFSRNGTILLERTTPVTYPLLLDTAVASVGATVRGAVVASIPETASGGFLEKAGSQTYRDRFTPSQIASFLPANGVTGPFTFPAPYHTAGVRLTSAADCGGGQDCLWPVGYSYWRNINNHVGSDTMYILLGFNRDRGGAGPSLMAYNKLTDQVQNVGPLFSTDSPYSYSTTEGWYFSATMPSRLYTFLPGGTTLRRYDVFTRQFESTPALDLNACPRPSVCPTDAAFIFQPHSSDDDRIHSATVQDASFQRLGCAVSDSSTFVYVPTRNGYALDECHVDKSGRWLLVLETQSDGALDNRVVDLSTGTITAVTDAAGALGHLDAGFGYAIGADNYNSLPNASILLKFPLTATERPLGPVVHFNKRWDIAAANHIAHGNALAGRPPDEQYACGSNASRVADMADEIVCFSLNPNRHADGSLDVLVVGQVMTDLDAPGGNDLDGDDYEQLPKGNLDLTGRYFIWTANLGGDRLDAFLVKVPAELLAATDHTPVAADKGTTTQSGDPVTITLTATDVETCELLFSISTPPAHGTLSTLGNHACATGAPHTDTAQVTYTPAVGFAGADSFTYVVSDAVLSASATVAISVTAVNNAPVAADINASTVVGTPVPITLSATDVETCELVFAVGQAPASGTLGPIEGDACVPGSPNRDTARVTYTPGDTGTYTFTYTAYDGGAQSAPATVTVTVAPAQSDAVSVDSIQPDVVTQGAGTVAFIITGTGFAPGITVEFQHGSGPAPRVHQVTADSSTQLSAVVEIRSGGPPRDRLWDVRVANPDGSTGVGVGLLRITP